jgi:hypothetical protein
MVVDWYKKYLGTPYEGSAPPFLWHHYVGHDDNRDWYTFTQAETKLTGQYVLNAWRPQIVYDVHQQGANAARHYMLYHAGLRILTESASAGIASPVDIAFDKLQPGRGRVMNTRPAAVSFRWPSPMGRMPRRCSKSSIIPNCGSTRAARRIRPTT